MTLVLVDQLTIAGYLVRHGSSRAIGAPLDDVPLGATIGPRGLSLDDGFGDAAIKPPLRELSCGKTEATT
jgi:hypothetical protein